MVLHLLSLTLNTSLLYFMRAGFDHLFAEEASSAVPKNNVFLNNNVVNMPKKKSLRWNTMLFFILLRALNMYIFVLFWFKYSQFIVTNKHQSKLMLIVISTSKSERLGLLCDHSTCYLHCMQAAMQSSKCCWNKAWDHAKISWNMDWLMSSELNVCNNYGIPVFNTRFFSTSKTKVKVKQKNTSNYR